MNKNILIIVVVGILIIIVVAFFLLRNNNSTGNQGSSSSSSKTSTSTVSSSISSTISSNSSSSVSSQSSVSGETVDMSISMGGMSFSPNVIEVAAGTTVNLTITNTGGLHNFNIDDLNAHSEDSNTGETTTITFTIPSSMAGQDLEFYCSYHKFSGMVGTLRIQ